MKTKTGKILVGLILILALIGTGFGVGYVAGSNNDKDAKEGSNEVEMKIGEVIVTGVIEIEGVPEAYPEVFYCLDEMNAIIKRMKTKAAASPTGLFDGSAEDMESLEKLKKKLLFSVEGKVFGDMSFVTLYLRLHMIDLASYVLGLEFVSPVSSKKLILKCLNMMEKDKKDLEKMLKRKK